MTTDRAARALVELLDPVQLAAGLAQLPPDHLTVLLARAAVEHGAGRSGASSCPECAWREAMFRGGPADLLRRRYPPTGDRWMWVRYGPDGPPPVAADEAAA